MSKSEGKLMTDDVVVSDTGRVRRIQMSRPEKKNALTRAMYQLLAKAIADGERDPAVRVMTIAGTGDAFTSGNDVADFADARPTDGEIPAMAFLGAISQMRKPLLAGVNGIAVGIGVTMLLHCDLVYAAEEAMFQLPFVNLGLVPEAASSLLLPTLIGHHRAAELLFFGDRFDAHAAREMGLVNAVYPRETLHSTLDERAAVLAEKPPTSLRLTKELLKGGAFATAVSARLAEERSHFEQRLQSPEAREAMEAFRQKRAPDFSRFT
jgi:enoyl-CoA hydratase/carnithine racemase